MFVHLLSLFASIRHSVIQGTQLLMAYVIPSCCDSVVNCALFYVAWLCNIHFCVIV